MGDQAVEVLSQGRRHLRWATGAGTVGEAPAPLSSKARDPLPQRSIRTVPGVGDGWEAGPWDDLAHGLGTPAHARLLGLF